MTDNQPAFAIPCNLIIQADTEEHASKAALVMLREVLGSRVFDPADDGSDAECIGFDHDEEVEANK